MSKVLGGLLEFVNATVVVTRDGSRFTAESTCTEARRG
jgi:hypothetical protein